MKSFDCEWAVTIDDMPGPLEAAEAAQAAVEGPRLEESWWKVTDKETGESVTIDVVSGRTWEEMQRG